MLVRTECSTIMLLVAQFCTVNLATPQEFRNALKYEKRPEVVEKKLVELLHRLEERDQQSYWRKMFSVLSKISSSDLTDYCSLSLNQKLYLCKNLLQSDEYKNLWINPNKTDFVSEMKCKVREISWKVERNEKLGKKKVETIQCPPVNEPAGETKTTGIRLLPEIYHVVGHAIGNTIVVLKQNNSRFADEENYLEDIDFNDDGMRSEFSSADSSTAGSETASDGEIFADAFVDDITMTELLAVVKYTRNEKRSWTLFFKSYDRTGAEFMKGPILDDNEIVNWRNKNK